MPATTLTWPWNNGTTSNPTTTTPPTSTTQLVHLPNNNNNDFMRAKVIFHQPQQQNLQFPFNLISGKNQKFYLDHSDRPTTTGLSTDPAKKKRGRPRKYSADGNIDLGLSPTPVSQNSLMVNPTDPSVGGINTAASLENPSKKGCWRPPGSEKQQQQQRETSGEVGFGFTPHLININIGEDIASKIMTFLQQTPRVVGILSATGVVRKVTLQQFAGGCTMTYKVDVVSFVEKGVKPNSMAPSLTQPPNILNFGVAVTETSSPSPGASSHSADEKGGSLLNH